MHTYSAFMLLTEFYVVRMKTKFYLSYSHHIKWCSKLVPDLYLKWITPFLSPFLCFSVGRIHGCYIPDFLYFNIYYDKCLHNSTVPT